MDEGRSITPAAEWVLDNYHVVEEQIREIREDLPPQFYRQLPKLADGPFAGFPRVFGIAWAFVAHTDSRFDPETLRRFVRAYQSVEPLTIGELWAVAITLRIVLVENLRRVAQRIVAAARRARKPTRWPTACWASNGQQRDPMRCARGAAGRRAGAAFAVQLVQRLRDQDPKVTPALLWLEERARRTGHQLRAAGAGRASAPGRLERHGAQHHHQHAAHVGRRLGGVLREREPGRRGAERLGSDFAAMDFATRNLYRNAIEELARGSPLSELEIAAAESLRRPPRRPTATPRERDPGFHLIADGRRALERAIGFRAPLARLAEPHRLHRRRARLRRRDRLHLGAGAGHRRCRCCSRPASTAACSWLFGALGVVPAIDVAVALVNRAVTRGVGASRLPGLALRDGVPEDLRTLVAMPVLLTSRAAVEEHLHRLEIHYLASPDDQLHFALLSDWTDADAEQTADRRCRCSTSPCSASRG